MKLDRRELAKRVIERSWQQREERLLLRISGLSMGSAIPDGSTVEVVFSEKPVLRRGDIVYFRRSTRRVAHRLLAAFGPLCIEKGDGNPWSWFCLRSSILGTVHLVNSPSAESRVVDAQVPCRAPTEGTSNTLR